MSGKPAENTQTFSVTSQSATIENDYGPTASTFKNTTGKITTTDAIINTVSGNQVNSDDNRKEETQYTSQRDEYNGQFSGGNFGGNRIGGIGIQSQIPDASATVQGGPDFQGSPPVYGDNTNDGFVQQTTFATTRKQVNNQGTASTFEGASGTINISGGKINTVSGDQVNRNDGRSGGHNFDGHTRFTTQRDALTGKFSGGSFGGNGRGGHGIQLPPELAAGVASKLVGPELSTESENRQSSLEHDKKGVERLGENLKDIKSLGEDGSMEPDDVESMLTQVRKEEKEHAEKVMALGGSLLN
ncbi:hypothetical protein BDQ17DRAFT_1379690 [Cyathus striatus]|nr:hypothetical protein BDQ17DRAFT_1379690 [Cyathus striatus]